MDDALSPETPCVHDSMMKALSLISVTKDAPPAPSKGKNASGEFKEGETLADFLIGSSRRVASNVKGEGDTEPSYVRVWVKVWV